MTEIMKPGDLKQPPLPPSQGFTISDMADLNPSDAVSMLYYGASGVGKTVFVGSAGPRTFIVNIGNGIKSIQSQWAKEKFYKEGSALVTTINEERDPTTGVFKSADAWDKVADAIDYALAHFSDRFDTIAVDDATALRAFASNKGLELNAEFSRSKTLELGRKAGAFISGIQDFSVEMNLIQQFIVGTISSCQQNKKHFILTAHERHIFKKIRDQQGKIIGEEIDKIRPAFTGKTFPDDITGQFDLVWNATAARTTGATVYRAFTESTMMILAKSRFPKVFDNPENDPNFLRSIERIRKSIK